MLRLREHLARDERGIRRVVAEHQQLARAGRRVDRDRARRPAASPRRRTRCPGRRCGRRAARSPCRTPSRRSRPRRRARTRDPRRRAPPRRARRPTAGPSARRRRAEDDLADAGDARGHGAHQHAARIRRAPARRVHADAAERIGAPPDDDPRLALRLLRHGPERAVHAADVLAPRARAPRAAPGSSASSAALHARARHLELLERRRRRTPAPARAARRRPRGARAR